MATNHTANYELCQWEPTDQVQRTDFNADNAKIDAALSALESGKVSTASLNSAINRISALELNCATKTELSALESQVQDNASTIQQLTTDLTKITFGTYTGNGNSSRTISLGFTPKAVLLFCSTGATYYYRNGDVYRGGLAYTGHACEAHSITTNGFKVSFSYHDSGDVYWDATNESGYTYYYIAFA